MLISMTGYGRGNVTEGGVTATADIRSLNSRYLEIQIYIPRDMNAHEQDVKEIIRAKVGRGKITLNLNIERETGESSSLTLDTAAAKNVYGVLDTLRKELNLKDEINLSHLLRFSEVLKPAERGETGEAEWEAAKKAIEAGLDAMNEMRRLEGKQLGIDLRERIEGLQKAVKQIEKLTSGQINTRRSKLQERIKQLLDTKELDEQRIEMEIAMIADKLDITEECVRFRSHIKFFLELMDGKEAAGRKLNFLTQEMNREVNTMGSKSDDAEIARTVVTMKEELEKIREQLQNIE